jgi:hypothetical protein
VLRQEIPRGCLARVTLSHRLVGITMCSLTHVPFNEICCEKTRVVSAEVLRRG